MKKNLFDLPENKLKSEQFNERQISEFKNTLNNCKYARLKYNTIEISPTKKISFATDDRISEDESNLTDETKYFDTTGIYPKLPYQIPDSENKENLEEIDKLIEEKETCKSPVKYLVIMQSLSPDETRVVELADRKREEKLKETKEVKNAPKESLRNQIEKMREHQKLMMNTYQPETEEKESKIEEKKPAETIKTIDKEVVKEIQEPPKQIENIELSKGQDEIDFKAVQKLEQRLINFASNLKSIQAKCNASEHRDLLNASFTEIIRTNLADIEKVLPIIRCSQKETTPVKPKLDLNKLNQMEEKYSLLTKNLTQKFDYELEEMRKVKEREEAELRERKSREEQEQLQQAAFNSELTKYASKFDEMKKFLDGLKEKLDKQMSLVDELNDLHLLSQTNDLSTKIDIEKTCILDFTNEKLNKFKDIKIKTINEEEIQKTIESLKEFLIRCIKKGEEFEKRLKDLESRGFELKQKLAEESLKRRKAEEEEKAKKAKEKLEKQNIVKKVDNTDKNGVSEKSLIFYEKNWQFFNKIKTETDDAFFDKTLKNFKFDLQKAINFPLNSLLDDKNSEENRRNFTEKIRTLCRLLAGQTCAITSTLTVNPGKHAGSVDFCLVYLARKLVEKSEETVASRPETAAQYAQLAVEVIKYNQKFESLLLAQIYEKCPMTLPFYKPRLNGQTDEQYFESLGYKMIEGKLEEDVHYYKRMSGVMHFYFTTLLISTNKIGTNRESYFNEGINKLWCWITEVLNMTPRPNITAEALSIFFKCCGLQMQLKFKHQFLKIVQVCSTDFLDLIKSIPSEQQSGASIGRLENIIDEFKRNRKFPEWKLA